MYARRFPEPLPPGLTLRQIRGREGVRVRDAYARASRATGVPWHGRSYSRGNWRAADPVNRALSCANSCLYGLCHAAIVAAGYSPALGFVHTGKMLSFVYDVADLYKADLTVPTAFETVAVGTHDLEGRVRRGCRDAFHAGRLLPRIVEDIQHVLDVAPTGELDVGFDADAALPGGLWDPEGGESVGGVNWAEAVAAADLDGAIGAGLRPADEEGER
jgi:CRISPR-associated protein Cas1